MTVAEAIPAAPAIPALVLGVAGLLAFTAFLIATGMGKLYAETLGTFIRWLASKVDVNIGAFGHGAHPFRALAHGLYAVDTQIRNAFAAAALRAEAGAAWCFATAGHLVVWMARETGDLAHDVWSALQHTTVSTIPAAIRRAEASTLARLRGIDHAVGRIEAMARAELTRLRVGIDRLGHRLEAKIGSAVRTLNARVGITARQIRRLARRTTHVERLLGASAFAAAVAVALNRMGLRWLRCPSLGRIGRKVGCGGFAFLESLLAVSFEAWVVTDLCVVVTAMTKAARLFGAEIEYLSTQISGLVRCQNATRPRALSVHWHEPPPVVTSLEL